MIAGSHLLGQHCGFLCKCRICATLAPSLTPPGQFCQKYEEEKKLAMQYEQEHIGLDNNNRGEGGGGPRLTGVTRGDGIEAGEAGEEENT